jgi:subtilisin family serine protease
VAATQQLRRELLVAATNVAEADQQRAWLAGRGAQLLRRRTLNNLGWVLSVYRLPPETAPASLSAELTAQWPTAIPEINQRFAALATSGSTAPAEYARTLIDWPESCAASTRIAMLDGPVNLDLARLADRRIGVTQIAPVNGAPDYHHGTALAALLVGQDAPRGLLPEAELVVGVIMRADDDGPFTTTEWILHGLDWVLGLDPRPGALNLSFGGPRSAQLQRALEVVTGVMPVAAAAGNEGQKAVAFPASYPGVIAVTAVDARGRRWSRANTGDQVAIAAPGVEVWTFDGAGRGYYANGTSIATLFVTAALASAQPDQRSLDEWLAAHAVDAGLAGRDLEYGHGVLAMRGPCRRTGT